LPNHERKGNANEHEEDMIVIPRPAKEGILSLEARRRGWFHGRLVFLRWEIGVMEIWLAHELEDGFYVVRNFEWKDYFASAYEEGDEVTEADRRASY